MCIYVNQVGDEGARRLARVVRTNTALRTLSLTHNGLGGEGGEACVRALASRSSMTDLFLGGNGLSKALMEAADVQLTRIAQARSTVRGAMSQHALAAVVAAGAGAPEHVAWPAGVRATARGLGSKRQMRLGRERGEQAAAMQAGARAVSGGVAVSASRCQPRFGLKGPWAAPRSRDTSLWECERASDAHSRALVESTRLRTGCSPRSRHGEDGGKGSSSGQASHLVTEASRNEGESARQRAAGKAGMLLSDDVLRRLRANDRALTHLHLCDLLAPIAKQKPAGLSEGIGAAGASAVAEALRGNCHVTKLNLSRNDIGDAGAGALAAALQHGATALMDVDLRANNIGRLGAMALAAALKVNATVMYLDLRDNPIGEEGAERLLPVLGENHLAPPPRIGTAEEQMRPPTRHGYM